MTEYCDIPKGRSERLRVQRSEFKERRVVDVRIHFASPDGSTFPTKKGVTIVASDLPQLRAALEHAERDAFAAGEICAEDYERAGLPVITDTI